MTLHTLDPDRLPPLAEAPVRPGRLSGVMPALRRVLRAMTSRSGARPAIPDHGGSGAPGPVSPFLQGLVGPEAYWRGGD